MLVFSVGNSVVTEAELLQLQRNGELTATRVAEGFGRDGWPGHEVPTDGSGARQVRAFTKSAISS
jgi:hypothetical protein